MSTYAMKLIKTCSSFLPENNEDVEIYYGESSGGADESSLWGDTTIEILSNSSHTTYETISGSETLLSHLLHSVYGWDEYVKWCLGHDFMPLEDFVNELKAFDFDTVIESKILAREASGAALTAAETKILVKARAAAKAAVQVELKDAIYEMERKLAKMRSQLTALDSDREAYLRFIRSISTGLHMEVREIFEKSPKNERALMKLGLSLLDIIHDNEDWAVYDKWCDDRGMNGIDCLVENLLIPQTTPDCDAFFTFIESLPLAVCDTLRAVIKGEGLDGHGYASAVSDIVKDYDTWKVYSAKCIDMEINPIDHLVHILSGKTQKGNWSFDFCMVIEE